MNEVSIGDDKDALVMIGRLAFLQICQKDKNQADVYHAVADLSTEQMVIEGDTVYLQYVLDKRFGYN